MSKTKIKTASLRQNVPKLGGLLGWNMRYLMPINNLEIGEALNMIKSKVLVFMAILMLMEKEQERLEARNRETDDIFLNLYTDKAKGILSEQRFVKLTAAMEREQEENQKQLKELALSLRRSNEQESDVRTFIREIQQYATIQELDEGILNRLISRILVGEVKKVDREKFQEIKIIYNFVGEIPAVTE